MKKKFCIFLLIFSLCLLMGACREETGLREWEALKDSGTLRIGVVECPPYVYEDNGTWTGFDVALAQAVARELGLTPELVPLTPEGKWPSLNEGSVDCLWGGISATDDLGEQFALSQSYLTGTPVLVTASPVENSLTGLTLAVQQGSAFAIAAELHLAPGSLSYTATAHEALEQVLSGTGQGAVVDYAAALYYLSPSLTVHETVPLGTVEYAAVFRPESDLREKVNEALTDLQARGELEILAEEYGLGSYLVVG